MNLLEIGKEFNIDTGAPLPLIISSDNYLYVLFHVMSKESLQDPMNFDNEIIVLKFNSFLKYNFGVPSNETINGHPYFKIGMKSFSFYELIDSPMIEELKIIEQVHPYYDPFKWMDYKHYILTFHDNMFECIAKSYKLKNGTEPFYNKITMFLDELSSS